MNFASKKKIDESQLTYLFLADENQSAEMQHWAPDQPSGNDGDNCAFMTVGEDYHLSGFWEDVDCSTSGFYAICETY